MIISLICIIQLCYSSESSRETTRTINGTSTYPPVRLHRSDDGHVVLENGLVKVTLSNPQGMITGIQYGGISNLLLTGKEDDRGYWDIVWGETGSNHGNQDKLSGTHGRIIKRSDDQVELSFYSTYDPSIDKAARPLNVDRRFIMLRGSSGLYTYSIFERLEGWRGINIDEARVAFKLSPRIFDYMAVSDTRQRFMPTSWDRTSGQELAYQEAVLLTNSDNSKFKGEVDDKYQYSADIKDNRVHGWISSSSASTVGFWVITPSNEFRICGPLKQELTSHVGPTSLAMFFSSHYAGTVSPKFEEGETWKKVFGPVFIYLNSVPSNDADPRKTLWENAKQQMSKETQSWPYKFPVSIDYPRSNHRGTVSGRLLIRDRYINKRMINGKSAYVGLAKPGGLTSWQYENKGYQFWTQADNVGNFTIKNIRAGNYSLFAWVPGVIGDFKYQFNINIQPGAEIKLGSVIYDPLRSGPTIWEIGIPDRTAAEFYVPDPNPRFLNHLFVNNPENKFRQYGLWDRYTDLYPDKDLVYTVGSSDYKKDWFYAHVTRRIANITVPTTWTIIFNLKQVNLGTYTLRIALASASLAELQVRVNDQNKALPDFTTHLIGRDNAIARHGIHGLYTLHSIEIPSSRLLQGRNSIYLKQTRNGSLVGFMYDYLRLEGPHHN